MLKHSGGAHAPLFERLVDDDPLRREPFRVLNRAGLTASVRRELQRLLETRCPVGDDEVLAQQRTVFDYGTPDLSTVNLGNPLEVEQLRRRVEKAVAAYEPRLLDVRVSMQVDQARAASERIVMGEPDIGKLRAQGAKRAGYPVASAAVEGQAVESHRLAKALQKAGRQIAVHIEGLLRVEQVLEPVTFDLRLDKQGKVEQQSHEDPTT